MRGCNSMAFTQTGEGDQYLMSTRPQLDYSYSPPNLSTQPPPACIESRLKSSLLLLLLAVWLQYTAGSPGYQALAKEVQGWEHQPNSPAGRLFYLALPPYVYPEVRRQAVCVERRGGGVHAVNESTLGVHWECISVSLPGVLRDIE
jgi:hypothetical protein